MARAKRRIQAMISLSGVGKAYHAAEDYYNNTPFKPWTEEQLLQLFKEKHPAPLEVNLPALPERIII